MNQEIKELEVAGSWHSMRFALGELLGIGGPVTSAVLNRARSDDDFAMRVLNSKMNPDALTPLLEDEENESYSLAQIPEAFTNFELLKGATKAILNWTVSGFQTVSEENYDSRIGACNQCDFLKDAGSNLVYKIKLNRENDRRICGACGCGVSNKAWLTTETCPVENPAKPGSNMWDETHQMSMGMKLG